MSHELEVSGMEEDSGEGEQSPLQGTRRILKWEDEGGGIAKGSSPEEPRLSYACGAWEEEDGGRRGPGREAWES